MGYVNLAALSITALASGLSLYVGGANVYGVALASALAVGLICGCAVFLHVSIGQALVSSLLFVGACQGTYVVAGLLNELGTGQCKSLSKRLRSRRGAGRLDRDP